MVLLTAYKNKTVAVLGLGISGLACADGLVKSGAVVKAWDDKENARNRAAVENNIPIVNLIEEDFSSIAVLVISPGIPTTHPVYQRAKGANCLIYNEAKLLWDSHRKARYIGITGTNGKSTTTAVIEFVLKSAGVDCAAGGNLGTPAVSLPGFDGDGVYILEMSSYALEHIEGMRFDIGVFINLTQDHLERHGNMDGYFLAKSRLFDNMTCDDFAVICVDDDYGHKMADTVTSASIVKVSQNDEVNEYSNLGGEHNRQNIACVRAVCSILNISTDIVEKSLQSFPGLRHRQQIIRSLGHVTFVNDSKATNPESAVFALRRFNDIHWIVGGREKTGDYGVLSPVLRHVVKAYLIGEGADNIQTFLNKHDVKNVVCRTLDIAVKTAYSDAKNVSCVVLLSPACSSFDQFENFEKRGDQFIKYVSDLQ